MNRGCSAGMALLLVASLQVIAADPVPEQELDEVVVRGTAVQLRQLRDQVREAEDLFYERFNELNTVRDFDVHCGMETPTGTQLKHRRCRVVFEEDAMMEEGQEAIAIRQQFQSTGPSRAGPIIKGAPPNPSVKINALRPAFQKHMRAVVSRDPELIELLQKRQALSERYQSLRRELLGLDPKAAGAQEEVASSD